VLSDFGMVPAAAIGLDIARLPAAAQEMVRAVRACGPGVPPADNPGVVLGTIIGVAARSGRDKVTIVASPGIGGFGAWLEQLLGESTGKQGKGVIGVDGEPLGPPQVYGHDRLFVYLRLADATDGADGADGTDAKQNDAVAAIERAGHPVLRIDVAERYCIGQEFFRWEIATAVAAAILGVNPFESCACISAPTWRPASRPSGTPCGRLSGERITAARKQNARLPRLASSTGLIEQNQ
jgi:transaldolase / glucose-6-phosphate isomerase